MNFWSLTGLIIVGLVALKLVFQLGKSLPVIELMLLIAGAQWIVSPYSEYVNPSKHYKYYMYVPENEYMSIVVPAYMAFVFFTLITLRKANKYTFDFNEVEKYSQYGVKIFLIGVFFDISGRFLPSSLAFFAFIVANFKYIGAIMLFFSTKPRDRMIFYYCIGYLFLIALAKAMFHELIIWSVFLLMFWSLKLKPKRITIITILTIGILSVSTIQTIKMAYREKIWGGYTGNKIELFWSLVSDAVFKEPTQNSLGKTIKTDDNNLRYNQGWIISAVFHHTPLVEPFADGETISEAISSSLLPRFLDPNKKKAGGQENFRRFTGLLIAETTSMGISMMGEGYANFGPNGVIVFFVFWSLFVGFVWQKIINLTSINSLFVFFIPLLFLQVIKAETELATVLNHLLKTSFVVFMFFWFVKNSLKWNVQNEENEPLDNL